MTERERVGGMAMLLGGALSNQVGAATAALAFPVIGPAIAAIAAAMVVASLGPWAFGTWSRARRSAT